MPFTEKGQKKSKSEEKWRKKQKIGCFIEKSKNSNNNLTFFDL